MATRKGMVLPVLVFLFLLAGCAGTEKVRVDRVEIGSVERLFSESPGFIEREVSFVLKIPSPVELGRLADVEVKGLAFQGTLGEFVSVLEAAGIPAVVKGKGDIRIRIAGFTGRFRDLARALSGAYGLWFEEESGIVVIRPYRWVEADLPSLPPEIVQDLEKRIKLDGRFRNLAFLPASGTLGWEGDATTAARFRKIFRSVVNNYALVRYEVLVFESSGFEVESRDVGITYEGKDGKISGSLQKIARESHGLLAGKGSLLTLAYTAGNFNLTFEMLRREGRARVVQKVLVSTVNLMPVLLKVGESVPFVKSVSREKENTGGTSLATTEVEFGEALSGIEVRLVPRWINPLRVLESRVEIKVNDVLEIVEVKTGEESYSRPRTVSRVVSSHLLLDPGKIYVFGGFSYE
ncbi:MAG TPA: hypothetical protein EYP14_01495, partial [Planctomycetaceae bacterium]|nr:hypothetical protein [Planctomycetaceae bacterium]